MYSINLQADEDWRPPWTYIRGMLKVSWQGRTGETLWLQDDETMTKLLVPTSSLGSIW